MGYLKLVFFPPAVSSGTYYSLRHFHKRAIQLPLHGPEWDTVSQGERELMWLVSHDTSLLPNSIILEWVVICIHILCIFPCFSLFTFSQAFSVAYSTYVQAWIKTLGYYSKVWKWISLLCDYFHSETPIFSIFSTSSQLKIIKWV